MRNQAFPHAWDKERVDSGATFYATQTDDEALAELKAAFDGPAQTHGRRRSLRYDGDMAISAAAYENVALEDGDTVWEYVCGSLREKPSMTQAHNDVAFYLAYALASQLDRAQFRVRANSGRVRTTEGNAYVPDVMVVPTDSSLTQKGTRKLESFGGPVPFVAEVWSPSTGAYDIDTKLPEYRARGDGVIWRIHPYEQLVQAWERQPDGSYSEHTHRTGAVRIPSLPHVTIELAAIFE